MYPDSNVAVAITLRARDKKPIAQIGKECLKCPLELPAIVGPDGINIRSDGRKLRGDDRL